MSRRHDLVIYNSIEVMTHMKGYFDMKMLYRRMLQLVLGMLTTLACALALHIHVLAATDENGIQVDFVWIQIDYDTFLDDDLKDESDVSVQINTDGVYLEEKSITNLPSVRWHCGNRPVLKLVLRTRSNYYFTSSASKTSNIYVDGYGDCTSASRSDGNSQLTVKIKLEEVEEGDWDDDDDDWDWSHTYSSNTPGGYGPGGSSQGSSGAWLKDSTGWWYCYPDKSYPRNTWINLNGLWYYFGSDGYLFMNKWVLWNNLWYYCGSDGAMLRNTYTPDGYWVDGSGVWYPSAGYSSGTGRYYYNSSGPGV